MESMATKPLYETSFYNRSSRAVFVLHVISIIIIFRFNKTISLFKRLAKEYSDMIRWLFSTVL